MISPISASASMSPSESAVDVYISGYPAGYDRGAGDTRRVMVVDVVCSRCYESASLCRCTGAGQCQMMVRVRDQRCYG